MKKPPKSSTGERPQRRDRLIRERVHDPYKTRLKLPEPTICPQCGAAWKAGRWQWVEQRPQSANMEMCQACHRINDKYPAGVLTLSGNFLGAHRQEITHLIHNTENAEKDEHPLHRIMEIEEQEGKTIVTTTDIHLPRRIGQAIHNAYEGEFNFNYDEAGYFIRVNWCRDD